MPQGILIMMTQPHSTERGANVRFPPPLVYLTGILLGVGLHYAVSPAPVPVGRTLSVVSGIAIILLGVLSAASARVLFSRTGQSPIPWKPTPELIFAGPYRFTRNPMYLGLTLVTIGLGVALNNLWISVFALPALAVVHLIAVLPEEKYLAERFGDSYREYCAQVRRYL